jgi:hypothetical protein
MTDPCLLPSACYDGIGTPDYIAFAAQYLASTPPLSTLRVLPHGSDPRMTRGQCGSLLLHCNGLSPSTSCRFSRRTAAQYLARGLPCERFTSALAGRRASLLGWGGWLDLPHGDSHLLFFAGLPGAHSYGVTSGRSRFLHPLA